MTSRDLRRLGVLSLSLLVPACGQGTSTGPSPLPGAQVTQPVSVVAFLDENENGVLDGSEVTRIPNVEVVVGGVKVRTAAAGQANLQAPEGMDTLEVTPASLPPFYRPPASRTITVPANGPVMVPITLPRGSNRANVYMAFGDSITLGDAAIGDGNGYRQILQTMLRSHFGAGTVVNDAADGTRSDFGAQRIGSSLASVQPAFTLILYGTNDWNDSACNTIPCFTTSSLRSMVQQVNRARAHAFLATITPSNTGYDSRAPASRNDWIDAQNEIIKQIAEEEGAVLVDLNAAIKKTGMPYSSLFVDHLHPTASTYQLLAQTWFDSIVNAYSKILSDF